MSHLALYREGRRYIVRTDLDLFHPELLPKTSVSGEADLVELAESGALFDLGDMLVFQLGTWQQVTIHFDREMPTEVTFEIDDTVKLDTVQAIYHQRLFNLAPVYAVTSRKSLEVNFHDDLEDATT